MVLYKKNIYFWLILSHLSLKKQLPTHRFIPSSLKSKFFLRTMWDSWMVVRLASTFAPLMAPFFLRHSLVSTFPLFIASRSIVVRKDLVMFWLDSTLTGWLQTYCPWFASLCYYRFWDLPPPREKIGGCSRWWSCRHCFSSLEFGWRYALGFFAFFVFCLCVRIVICSYNFVCFYVFVFLIRDLVVTDVASFAVVQFCNLERVWLC